MFPLSSWLAENNDRSLLIGRSAVFTRHNGKLATARIEGFTYDADTTYVILRYNGVTEASWYHPFNLPVSDVRLKLVETGPGCLLPAQYDSRPLTQR